MRFEIAFSCCSHIGKIRRMNQDNFICNGKYAEIENTALPFEQKGTVSADKTALFGVFDGMGGEECGEVASYIAAKESSVFDFGKDAIKGLKDYCFAANKAICDYAEENSVSSMGTTAAMLLFSKKEISLCNIGDSKIFRFAEGTLEQISTDHVAVGVFGKKPPLSQNLGIPPSEMTIEPYVSRGNCQNGDKYLICSDGLTDMVGLDEINRILKEFSTDEAVSKLVEKSLENGGRDNITIILLEIKKIKNKLLRIFTRG